MLKLIREIDKYEFIIIYFALLFFSGYWFVENAFTLSVITVGGLLLFRLKDFRINKKGLLLMIFIILMIILSEVLSTMVYRNGTFSLKLLIIPIVTIFISFLFASTMLTLKWKKNFIICMTIIAIFSIISNTIFTINPSLFSFLPKLINSSGRSGFFAIFNIISDFTSTGAQRNQGIFWEPGAFQFFLSLAYIFELSGEEHKPRKWILASLAAAMITTYSTTGVIVTVLLLTYSFSHSRNKLSVIKALIVVTMVIIAVCNIIPKLTGFWQYTLVKKIKLIFEYQPGVSNHSSVRVDSIFYPLSELLNSPIWGIGTEGYSKIYREMGHSMATFTPVNWLVKYGPIYGIVILSGIWRFLKNDFNTVLNTTIIFIILMISISTEAFQNNIFLLSMCFQGHIISSKNRNVSNYVGSDINCKRFECN